MISLNSTSTDYITPTIERDILNVFKYQRIIVEKNVYLSGRNLKIKKSRNSLIKRRTGRLAQSLENPSYRLLKNGGKWIAEADIMPYMRFLDMRRLGNRKIYNRQLWGILYRNTLPALKSQCLDQINTLGMALDRAAKADIK